MLKPVSQLRTALILIDIQQTFNNPSTWGSCQNTASFNNNVCRLLKFFREARAKVEESNPIRPVIIHVRHSSLDPGSPFNPANGSSAEFMPFARPLPDETTISKNVNSAFIGTPLEYILRERGIQQLVICGLTTDHCVSTTTRMAANLGWRSNRFVEGHVQGGNVILVRDACGTFGRGEFDAEVVHRVAIASLEDEFAEIVSTDSALESL
ncbi:hypothetical protein M433DRAFT_151774 [Acidomyces richmondensis BFW]|nr:MAG: hypothetical protein FE78DRAFT_94507 [Acidomyces sp. 'richmondensis']KYG47828.1 hypothetical protein M433DRAFT_151774 [Acidomyces richmondensis BFW]